MAKEKKEEAAVNTDKLKALQAAMEKIEKSYGKGAIMTLGNDHIENIEVIPTDSIRLKMFCQACLLYLLPFSEPVFVHW